ncbi:MAG: aminoacetone oxidase family FAD-binding enzyme [Eubacteriales bacterium]|nr:aminoacetone oxidase family FAD-binding enzyme [Eubacteriales bacterium]
MTTAIIGGGAAGVFAALAAAERGETVLVLDRNRKPLKKLGVTGNGRANLLNAGVPVYFGNAGFAKAVLSHMGYAELCAYFASVGVPLRQETEGRVYPAALLASVVTDALLLRAEQLGVSFVPLTQVTKIVREPGGFRLDTLQMAEPPVQQRRKALEPPETTPVAYRADRVIVTVGGSAAPAHGTDGTGYSLLTAFGHRLTPLKPALCALTTDKRRIAGLAGQRVRAGLKLLASGGAPLRETEGEVLFGENAVSGIAAMQLARFVKPGVSVSLELRPALALDGDFAGVQTLLDSLATLRRDRPLADLLTGAFTFPIAKLLLREANLGTLGSPIAALDARALNRLAATIADLRLPVTGTRGFEAAQVTAGGIDPADFDPATLESRLCPGLYAAGEVLDVDGDCGGFNLMFAFASGRLAGRAR